MDLWVNFDDIEMFVVQRSMCFFANYVSLNNFMKKLVWEVLEI